MDRTTGKIQNIKQTIFQLTLKILHAYLYCGIVGKKYVLSCFPQMGGWDLSRLAETTMLPLGPPNLRNFVIRINISIAIKMSPLLCDRCCCLQENLDMQLDRRGGHGPVGGGGRRSTLMVAPRVRRGCGGALKVVQVIRFHIMEEDASPQVEAKGATTRNGSTSSGYLTGQ